MTTLGKKWKIKDTTKMKGRHPKGEFKKGIIPWNKGKKFPQLKKTQKWKDAMSKMKGRKIDWGHKISKSLTGKHISEEAKKKMSIAKKGIKSPNWRGGLSFEPYSVDWTKTLKRSIRERDKYTCKICGKEPSISVHHIDYNKKNCNPINLITLCVNCHSKTNYNREKWLEYFNSK